jgi:hypothetical protein
METKPFVKDDVKECSLCGIITGWEFIFTELDTEPAICSRCVFKSLTGKDIPWKEGIVQKNEC